MLSDSFILISVAVTCLIQFEFDMYAIAYFCCADGPVGYALIQLRESFLGCGV